MRVRLQAGAGKFVAGKVNSECGCVTNAQIAGRVEGIRFGINPAIVCQRQLGDVAACAADVGKVTLADAHGFFDFRIVGDNPTGNGQSCLIDRDGSNVGGG